MAPLRNEQKDTISMLFKARKGINETGHIPQRSPRVISREYAYTAFPTRTCAIRDQFSQRPGRDGPVGVTRDV